MLEKYDEIWNKVTNKIKKEFDSESVYSKKYLKTNTISYEEKINSARLPKEGSWCIFLSVIILIDSVFSTGKNYYPGVFLE